MLNTTFSSILSDRASLLQLKPFEVLLHKMDNQTQNTQPDFGFIVNQPSEPTKKHRPRMLVMVAGGMFVLVVIVFIGSLFFNTKKNVQSSDPSGLLVQSLITNIQQNNTQQIINQTAPEDRTDSQTVTDKLVTPLTTLFDLSACTIGSTTTKDATYYTDFTCPYKGKNKGYQATLTVVTVKVQGQVYISQIDTGKVGKTNG